jgi:hypothetical protein
MNTPKKQTPTAVSLARIRKISRTLKLLLGFFFIAPMLMVGLAFCQAKAWPQGCTISGVHYATFSEVPAALRVMLALGLVWYVWTLVTCWQLLNLYGRGEIFSRANVRLYQRLGHLIFAGGLLQMVAQAAATGQFRLWPDTGSGSWIIGGLFVVMIAAIMEEGCKLREEQELTV